VATQAGLRRIQEAGEDTYEPGTQAPRASGRPLRDDSDNGDDNNRNQSDGDSDGGNDDAGDGNDDTGINGAEDFDDTQGTKEADCIEVADNSDYMDYGLEENDFDELA
jgi:hypothetical protein